MKKIFILLILVLGFTASGARAMEALPEKPPIPSDNPMSEAKIKLGRQLYFDGRLSKNGKVSCNTCHDVTGSGTDNKQFSSGVDGKKGGRNSPTVWNAAYMSVQFWDGRAPSLEDQAKGPLVNSVEMAMENHDAVVARIAKVAGYRKQFAEVFGTDKFTIDHVAKAIAAYERTLLTPNSSFDKFIKGDQKALSAEAKRGFELVKTVGCVACHMGPNFAGPALPLGQGFYQKFPVFPSDYDKKYKFSADLGRYEVTKNDAEKNLFRVPTWRNVELTAPYFHNGAVAKLDEAVRVMAKTQLNKELKDAEVSDIVAFLKSLTGVRPKEKMPELPKD